MHCQLFHASCFVHAVNGATVAVSHCRGEPKSVSHCQDELESVSQGRVTKEKTPGVNVGANYEFNGPRTKCLSKP